MAASRAQYVVHASNYTSPLIAKDCPLMASDWLPHQVRRQRDQLHEPGQEGEMMGTDDH